MKQQYFGLICITLGSALILMLLFVAVVQKSDQQQQDTEQLFVLPKRMGAPDVLTLPLAYGKDLNSGLWGFERILREKNLILGGNYQQICQSQGAITQQLSFWFNAPALFAKQNPTKDVYLLAASQVTQDFLHHHFVMDAVLTFADGIKLVRQEVSITLTKKSERYELVVRSKEGRFGAFKPKNPNTWLAQKRVQLKQQPLLQQGADSEKKIIAFRLGACN